MDRIRVSVVVVMMGLALFAIFTVPLPARAQDNDLLSGTNQNRQQRNADVLRNSLQLDPVTLSRSFHSVKLDVPDTYKIVVESSAKSIPENVMRGEVSVNPLMRKTDRRILSEESPTASPSESPTESRSVDHVSSQLLVAFEGEYCSNDGSVVCAIGLLCNGANTCVGAAKTGESCSYNASMYMCRNGNWCDCRVDNAEEGDYSNSVCTCVAEKGKGASCLFDYECKGQMACNVDNKCTRLYSLGVKKRAKSIDFCEPGLHLNVTGEDGSGTCQEISQVSCNVATDCTPGGRGVFDEIFYSCVENKCHYNGPYCWYYLPLVAQRGRYNNYYDGSEPHVSLETYENYGYCVYGEYEAAGSRFNKEEILVQMTYNFDSYQTVWVDRGFPCAFSAARCMIGSYCSVHGICELYPREGQKCGPAHYPGSVGDPYTQCDIYGFLTCDVTADSVHGEDYGPLGKCVKGSKKNGTACGYYLRNDPVYPSVQEWVTTACDESDAYFCNYDEYGVDAASGYCSRFGTVGPGHVASWGIFCRPDLYYNWRTDSTCKSYEEADISCGSWSDCINHVTGYFGTYYDDEHQVYTSHHYGWNYDNWFDAQVACVNNKCAYVGPTGCDSRYLRATDYKESNYEIPNQCPYVKCQLGDVTSPNFELCVSESSGFVSAPVLSSSMTIMIILLVAMALF